MTLVKAMLTTTDAGAVAINFQFNPESLSFARTVTWKVQKFLTPIEVRKL
jgi:hypothetical protein